MDARGVLPSRHLVVAGFLKRDRCWCVLTLLCLPLLLSASSSPSHYVWNVEASFAFAISGGVIAIAKLAFRLAVMHAVFL